MIKRILLAPKHTAFGDQICGFSNLVSMAEKYGDDLIIYAPVTWGIGSRTGLFPIIKQPSKGSLHLFQYVEQASGFDHGDVGIAKFSLIADLLGLKAKDIFVTRPYTEEKYLEFNMKKLDLKGIENMDIPSEPYITTQFDAHNSNRQWTPEQKERIVSHYKSLGYSIINLGGWDTGLSNLPNGINIMVKIMSNAVGHVGVDSALAHMALCLRKPCHVYTAVNGLGIPSLVKHGAVIQHPDAPLGQL